MPATTEPSVATALPAIADDVYRRLLKRQTCERATGARQSHPHVWGIAIVLYQSGLQRMLVVRKLQRDMADLLENAVSAVVQHSRYPEFEPRLASSVRLQLDFVLNPPEPVAFDGLQEFGLVPERFEFGVDGLRIEGAKKTQYFLPGDAFVKSVLGIGQLRKAIARMFPGEEFDTLKMARFRSHSFLRMDNRWIPLFRGLPVLGDDVTAEDLWYRADAAIQRVVRTQSSDGRFEYYYDVKTDSHVNHEHPTRDPVTDPFYNFVRHCGGVLTLLFYAATRGDERLRRVGLVEPAASVPVHFASDVALSNSGDGSKDQGDAIRSAVVSALNCYLTTLVQYSTSEGQPAAYAVDNQKGKLGASGLGLYCLALYQHVFADNRYQNTARLLANHILAETQESGEFRYYHTYSDRKVTLEENPQLFSFYYPGEALGGLAGYLKYICRDSAERLRIVEHVHRALRFLIVERPKRYPQHFAPLPSDSWLMMAINELFDLPEFRHELYRDFVFGDADQMCRQQYTPKNAIHPDYTGAFYYQYGDHPFPDGARAEGLTAAYLLALKTGDVHRQRRYFQCLTRAAWSCLHLCNTRESLYSAPNPEHALGSIRFKLTRQWVRVDTTEHVASFFLRFLPHFIVEAVARSNSDQSHGA